MGGEVVADMLAAIPHRASEGRVVWSTDGVGLGHAARHFTPEARHETWPLHAPDGGLSLIADARLDNRDELVAALSLPRHGRGFHTDGELILAAFLRWGEACVERLLGDFAFAVWDARRHLLFLARDHFGAKPLFYHHASDGSLFFGSEIKALFAAVEIPRTPDEVQVGLHFGVPVADTAGSTFFAAVRALPPAHTLSIGPEGLRVRKYWDLDETTELRLSSNREYAEGFRERFEAALGARLRGITPAGVTLSGGLDSSTIASVASTLTPGGIRTYSAIYPNTPESDERVYQRSIVERWGIPHAEYAADVDSPFLDHRAIVRSIDGWQSAGNLRLNWNLYRLASQDGLRVMLEGFDGDTVVSHGLGYFGELAQRGAWLRLGIESGSHARIKGIPVLPTVWSWWSNFWIYPRLDGYGLLRTWRRAERLMSRLRPGSTTPLEVRSPWQQYLRDDFVERVRNTAALRMVPTERAHHCRVLRTSIESHTTEILNSCGAAHGLDVRYPFFDRRLVEYCVSLPPEQKIRRGVTRMILRRAMAGVVPERVLSRKDKTNIEPGLARVFWQHERDRVQEFLDSGALDELSAYLDVQVCRDIFQKYVRGEGDAQDRLVVWLVLSYLMWREESAALV